MTENQQQEPLVVIIKRDQPTTKEQLTNAATQIGIALAVPALVAGGLVISRGVSAVRDKIAIKRATSAPQAPDTTDESVVEE